MGETDQLPWKKSPEGCSKASEDIANHNAQSAPCAGVLNLSFICGVQEKLLIHFNFICMNIKQMEAGGLGSGS